VGVLVGLFGKYRVIPVSLEGESEEGARKRLAKLVVEETGMKLLLQLLHPEKVVLRCEERV